ncbi:MAG: DUF1853 family protein [Bermanella sp.]
MAFLERAPALTIEPSHNLLDWLSELDQNPEPLESYLDNHNRVLLGSYFECLWQFFFKYNPQWQLLGHHIQVIDAKQTLGELDIIAQHLPEKCHYHIELAVKFYLKHPDKQGDELQDWLGPQSHDRLDLKLNKLQEKQLPFLYHQATQNQLKENDLPNNPEQRLVMKGYLFEPWPDTPSCFHQDINPNVLRAYWLHQQQVEALLQGQTSHTQTIRWALLPKSYWLGPYQHHLNSPVDVHSSDDIKTIISEHFTTSEYPFALMLIALEDMDGIQIESMRYLVVHDHWPTKIKGVKK